MVDVVLTHSYHLRYDAKQLRKMQPYRPLGTLYAASALRESGVSVAIFDTMLRDPEEFGSFLEQTQPRVIAIYEDDFNFVTKMCLSRMREVVWRFAEMAHEKRIPIVVHGSDASDNPELFFAQGIDYLLRGEAEGALLELCQSLLAGQPMEEIAGLTQARSDRAVLRQVSNAANNPEWSHTPYPPLQLTDFELYREAWKNAHGYFSVNMVASRGCPFRCNWCAKPISGNKFQLRAPGEVAEEMLQLKTHAQAEHLWFSDDVFALDRHWTMEFAHEVKVRKAALPFKVQSRADLMTHETVSALKDAGCAEVWMGVESGSQRVLDRMDKGLKISSVKVARKLLKDAGIRACYFLQFGYPGEKWDDLKMTIDLVRETHPDDVGISFSYPLPGTLFYARVQEQLGSKRNWSESDDLCILFQGEYTTEFYRAVRDALHAEVDSWSNSSSTTLFEVQQLWSLVEKMEPSSRISAEIDSSIHAGAKIAGFVSVSALSAKVGA